MRIWIAAVALLSTVIFACKTSENSRALDRAATPVSSDRNLPAVSYQLSLRTPKPVAAVDVTLAADRRIEMDNAARVITAGTAPSTITNMGTYGVSIDGAQIGNAWSVSQVQLSGKTVAGGNIYASDVLVGPQATVAGQIIRDANLTPSTVTSWNVLFPEVDPIDHTVPPFGSGTLAPGRYADVVVGCHGTLTLSTGIYYLESFELAADATLRIDQTQGPVFVYVRHELSYEGNILSTSGDFPDIVIGYLGQEPVEFSTPFTGTFISTNAALSLGSCEGGPHQGAFFAPSIHVASHTTVIYRAPLALLIAAPPPGVDGLEACARLVRPRDDLTGQKKEVAYQADIARYCTMPGASACYATLVGRANTDYTAAARRMVAQLFSPAQYLALSRDRTAKLHAAEASPVLAQSLCVGADSDNDWVPDAVDKCPETPDLTATDATGCPLAALPAAPSAADVQFVMGKLGFMINPLCDGAPAPPEVSGVAMYQSAAPSNGTFIVAQRITNQPQGCSTWYSFEIRVLPASGGTPWTPFNVAFMDRESVASVGGLPGMPPVPTSLIQFNARPTDAGSRGGLGSIPLSPNGIMFRVQAVNGNGVRGPWSQWKISTVTDCLQLGIRCSGR